MIILIFQRIVVDIFYSIHPSGQKDEGMQYEHIDDDSTMSCDSCLPSCSEEVGLGFR